MKTTIKSIRESDLWNRIEFWILVFFIVRLIGITNPPVEKAHNWRQVTVNMVARNFYEGSADIRYPKVDMAGDKTGITAMEFPLLNYSIYLVSEVFGYNHWYDRLINLVVSSLGVYFFYLLLRRFYPSLAFSAALLLLGSIWFSYSRKIMPDTFATSFLIAALYFAYKYLYEKGFLNLLLAGLLIALGSLSKIPVAYCLVLLALPMLDRRVNSSKKVVLSLVVLVFLLPTYYWYFIWNPYLTKTFGFNHFFLGEGMLQGAKELWQNFPDTAKRFYEDPIKFIGTVFAIIGLVLLIKRRDEIGLWALALLSFGFFIVMLKAGFTFSHHHYYIIPFVPVVCFLAAYGLTIFKNAKMAKVFLVAIILESTLNLYHDFKMDEKNVPFLTLEENLDKISNRKDLIFINTGDYPTSLYFAHRKGWVGHEEWLATGDYLEILKSKGLKYMVLFHESRDLSFEIKHSPILENADYAIYEVW